jgi:hypothetical protein
MRQSSTSRSNGGPASLRLARPPARPAGRRRADLQAEHAQLVAQRLQRFGQVVDQQRAPPVSGAGSATTGSDRRAAQLHR